MATYSDDVKIYDFGDSVPKIVGKDGLKFIYEDVFESSPSLHAVIQSRIVFGNKVIDDEVVTGRKGVDRIRVVVVYEVEQGVISEVTFIRQ